MTVRPYKIVATSMYVDELEEIDAFIAERPGLDRAKLIRAALMTVGVLTERPIFPRAAANPALDLGRRIERPTPPPPDDYDPTHDDTYDPIHGDLSHGPTLPTPARSFVVDGTTPATKRPGYEIGPRGGRIR